MATLNIRVAASGDDDWCQSDGTWSSIAAEVYLGKGPVYTFDSIMRFLNVTIAPGSTINSAILRNVSKGTRTGTSVLTNIVGEDADDPTAPTSCVDLNGRARTTAFTPWDNIPAWAANETYDSPDFAGVIQEIIDRPGWASGNAMNIFYDDDGSSASAYRDPYSYDGSPGKAVELRIDYTPPVGGGYVAIF